MEIEYFLIKSITLISKIFRLNTKSRGEMHLLQVNISKIMRKFKFKFKNMKQHLNFQQFSVTLEKTNFGKTPAKRFQDNSYLYLN